MIDVSKIRVGDEVTVRCIVKEVAASDINLVVVKPSSNPGKYFPEMCISKDWIATHTPTPREFEPGDRVTFWCTHDGKVGRGVILAIDEDYAWVKAPDNPTPLGMNRGTLKLSELIHADESE